MIYVAQPYSCTPELIGVRKELMEARYQLGKAYCAHLKHEGVVGVYAPIVHNHHLAADYNLPKTNEFWKLENLHMLAKSDALHVLQLEGHKTSFGLATEMNYARVMRIEILNIPEEFFILSKHIRIGATPWLQKHRELVTV